MNSTFIWDHTIGVLNIKHMVCFDFPMPGDHRVLQNIHMLTLIHSPIYIHVCACLDYL